MPFNPICICRLAGSIPGPILFGHLIDRTCVLWQTKPCTDETGSCLLYDNWTMAYSFLTVLVIVRSLGVIFFGCALYFSQRSHIKDEVQD